jgi:hypothetical protein
MSHSFGSLIKFKFVSSYEVLQSMNDSLKKTKCASVVGDSLEFTYRLVETSGQNMKTTLERSPLRCHKLQNLSQVEHNQIGVLDLTSSGNLATPEDAERSLSKALEYLTIELLGCASQMPYLQVDMLQDILLFMEDYVKDKIKLKLDALSEFFGDSIDDEQHFIFKMLLRRYSRKMRDLDLPEIEKLKLLCSRVVVKNMALFNQITEKEELRGGLKLTSTEIEVITSHLEEEREKPNFENAMKHLHEATLLLILSHIPGTLGIVNFIERKHHLSGFKDHSMISLNKQSKRGVDILLTKEHCLKVLPQLNFPGSIHKTPEFVISLPQCLNSGESPTFHPTSSCVSFAPADKVLKLSASSAMKHRESCNGTNAKELFEAIKQETVITFEASEGNIAIPRSKRQKKSVTFSEKDWVIEYDSEKTGDDNKASAHQKTSQSHSRTISEQENKENVPTAPKAFPNHRKILNLKELQLNPKHFVGRRQQASTKLKLIHDSEESIDVSKGNFKDKKPIKATKRPSITKDQLSNQTILTKKIDLNKDLHYQNRSVQSSIDKKIDSNNISLCKPGTGMMKRSLIAPLVEIDLSNSQRKSERDRSNSSLQKKIEEMGKLSLEPRQQPLPKNPSSTTNMTSKKPAVRHRSASSHNLKLINPQKQNFSVFNSSKENRTPQIMCLDDQGISSRGRLARSLSSSRRLVNKTYTSTLNEPLSKYNYFEKISDSTCKRDDNQTKYSMFGSKLNFLTYDKQPREGQRGLLSTRMQDKPSVIDMAVYKRIFATNSSRAGKNSSSRVSGTKLFGN